MPQQAQAPDTSMLKIGNPKCFNPFYILYVFLKLNLTNRHPRKQK